MNNIKVDQGNTIENRLDRIYDAIMITNKLELIKQLHESHIIDNPTKSAMLRDLSNVVFDTDYKV